jgi:hypothetical protein
LRVVRRKVLSLADANSSDLDAGASCSGLLIQKCSVARAVELALSATGSVSFGRISYLLEMARASLISSAINTAGIAG